MKNSTKLLIAIPQLILILAFIALSAASSIHSQLLSYGEENWQDYATLRADEEKPTCLENLEQQQQAQAADDETGNEEDDDLDDLFGEEEEEASDEALEGAKKECLAKIERYEHNAKLRQDDSLKSFVALEKSVATIVHASTEYGRHFLVLLLAFCMLAATLARAHLALRDNTTKRGDRINQASQLIANLLLAGSFLFFNHELNATGLQNASILPIMWATAFALPAIANLVAIIKPRGNDDKPSIPKILLAIPLYVHMTVIGTLYFAAIEQHFSGLAIFISLLTEHATLYINVALYVFAGMMLKNTLLANKAFDILRPWKLSPEILVFVVVAASAIPTAYSGASGIFVIAAGAIIYRELTQAGVRDSLARASTAMSGSMGMVLSPSLLVVIVAALNKDVTTDQLFGAGKWVFLTNIVVFAIVIAIVRKNKFNIESPKIALKPTLIAIRNFLPYLAIGAAIILIFRYPLASPFDAYSAPIQLPFILLAILIFEAIQRTIKRRKSNVIIESSEDANSGEIAASPTPSLAARLIDASQTTSINAGALLTLMALSIALGGIIERANIAQLLPQTFSSPFLIMLLLFFLLVFIGMIMDPYGAVILVSASFAQLALNNGIDPTHFWLTVLTAFELGYLTPPVALNHLLTRQIIDTPPDTTEATSFYQRHERILFPIAVKATVLIIVAFGPLIFLY